MSPRAVGGGRRGGGGGPPGGCGGAAGEGGAAAVGLDPADLPEAVRFKAVPLALHAETTLPDPTSLEFLALGFSRAEMEAYLDRRSAAEEAPMHRLLGHPQVIQNEMQTECQTVTARLAGGPSSDAGEPGPPSKGALDWRLLLQIDTDHTAGMGWGDSGRIYFWIRSPDLAARRFDRTWLILQCY